EDTHGDQQAEDEQRDGDEVESPGMGLRHGRSSGCISRQEPGENNVCPPGRHPGENLASPIVILRADSVLDQEKSPPPVPVPAPACGLYGLARLSRFFRRQYL